MTRTGTRRERNWWGWGFADARIDPDAIVGHARATFGFGGADGVEDPVALADIALPAPRLDVSAIKNASVDHLDRLHHSFGKSYLDTIRAFRGTVDHAVDAVAHPADERELEAVLEWAGAHNAAVIPFGGGTSVVGGVQPRVPDRFDGTLSVDLSRMSRLLELDEHSRSALIQAGACGPVLEDQLRAHGLTLRFFPQSFELSTLGGWIATRAGGHFATARTHIDDLVESVRAITPVGAWESRRLPGSGAGVSPDRMLLGSEGTLGIITQAWMRVQPRPAHRASEAVRFSSFAAGAEAVRAIAQSGLTPANLRLLDELEALQTGAGDGTHAVLVLGFESTAVEVEVDDDLRRGLSLCRAHGGVYEQAPRGAGSSGGAVDTWRDAFLAMPYLRDAMLRCGVLSDTFETAITWERFPAFHEAVTGAVRAALGEPCRVSCRFTHVYPDGPAPYYTVIAPARRGDEVAQWWEMKRAASDAITAAGATITHHHAVGRDHRPWYDVQRPDVFASALAGAKAAVDPRGLLNPGVLLD
ncbi:MAG: FAD-binding oxidoreductase [Solirubrobacterales bacterium]|nr:FAD-binding oxidoreductase [Solirubrobacterales bacterium]